MKIFYRLIIVFFVLISFEGINANDISKLEKRLIKQGLVDVKSMDSSIQVDMKYSTEDNFLHKDVYDNFDKAYLQKAAAKKLVNAQKILKEIKPGFSLLVYDALRPQSVQYAMWKIVKGTASQGYVANPDRGSIHNYGCAVDLTIVDANGRVLDMGTPFDYFGKLAQPRYESHFLKLKKLTFKQIKNRKLLRNIMIKAGFRYIKNEWWHFDAYPRSYIKKRYGIIK